MLVICLDALTAGMVWVRNGDYYRIQDPGGHLFVNVIRHAWRRQEYEASIYDGSSMIFIQEFDTFREALCAAENTVIDHLLCEPGAFGFGTGHVMPPGSRYWINDPWLWAVLERSNPFHVGLGYPYQPAVHDRADVLTLPLCPYLEAAVALVEQVIIDRLRCEPGAFGEMGKRL